METLLHVSLSNAVLAGGLAIVAAVVGAVCRRPAVVHCLWLLVLLKLVTPPLLHVPLTWPTESSPPSIAEPLPVEAEVWVAEDAAPADVELVEAAPIPTGTAPAWPWLVGLLWMAGSTAWLTLAVWRTCRFHALLRHAEPVPGWLSAEAEYLAARLGLPFCPPVWLLPGRISPMLWSLGGAPRLFLPAELLDRLSSDARAALLTHELAHLRRGDHRVRWLELVCTVLYWWNPVLWWARRQLREAEEQCCDAWVVWALPAARRAYALVLVDTVDFLSEAPTATPVLASGFGPIDDLRKRVTMIMRGTTPRDLSWIGGLAVLGLGAFLLPLTGSWAEEPPRDEVIIRRESRNVEARDPRAAEPERREDADQARRQLDEARKRVEEIRARLKEAEAELHRAEERIAAGVRVERHDHLKIIIQTPDGKVKEIELPAGARVVTPEGLERRRIELDLRTPNRPIPPPAPGAVPSRPGTPAPGVVPGRPVPTPRPGGEGGPRGPGGPDAGRGGDLERRLDQLLREMEELRSELRREPRGPAGVVPRPPVPPTPPMPPVAPRR